MPEATVPTTTVRWYPTVDELLAGATAREPMKTGDSLSGSRLERALIGGDRYVVKYLCVDDDWLMRATGDTVCRQARMWQSPYMDRVPEEIDPALAGGADHVFPGGRQGAVLLLRDVGEHLVPAGGERITLEQELRFLDHMAALHAAFWGWHDPGELMPVSHHYSMLTPVTTEIERARGTNDPVPPLIAPGWRRFRSTAPRAAALILSLVGDPGPLVASFAGTPSTFVHADWKLGNLGSYPDGRTILLDWDRCGEGPPCLDLAWYLAVNCDRLPHAKEDAIDAYRAGLERRGIDTRGWWDRQLGLALIGGLAMLGWAKAAGDRAELRWWEERALEASHYLG